MEKVRLGIVGMGGMGRTHARSFLDGRIQRVELAAVCDEFGDISDFVDQRQFSSAEEMFRSGVIDAVLIATPHFSHTTLGMAALEAGLHVLIEKPISVHKGDCEKLIATPRRPDQVFAAMFQMRLNPLYQKVKQLIWSGEVGRIQRINWTITDWFRTDAYYKSGSWRATWKGEGGGVLINQCPHQLDLWQWFFGMPKTVHALCGFGKYHSIEVEDEVTAIMEYENGATAVFATSTGEAPGVNRLEIAGDRGLLTVQKGRISFLRNEVLTGEHARTSPTRNSPPPCWDISIPVTGVDPEHAGLMQNFVDAILGKAELIAPAEEGIRSVELANAMLLSQFLGRTVELPISSSVYEAELSKRM